jgi:hypothetical protein
MKNKKTWITIIVLVLLLGGCFGDRVISEIVFYYYCDKNSGLYVYEEVGLSDEYFTKESKSEKEFNYFYTDKLYLSKEKVDANYNLVMDNYNIVFKMGPIKIRETYIIRRKDNKTLSKSISFVSGKGWLNQLFSFGYSGKSCPYGIGNNKGEFNKDLIHKEILKKTFNKI